MGQNTPMGSATVLGTNSGGGVPKTWQCSQCKVKKTWIYIPGMNDKQTVEQKLISKHKCQTCPKCNKLSSYEDLVMHENFECSANPLNQSQVNQNNQLLANIRQSLQTTIQDIKNDPNLTPQQKNDLVNNLSPAVSNLQKLLDDLEEKQKKISDSGGNQNKPTNWTPWIIGGIALVIILLIVIGIIFYRKKEKN